MSPELWQAAKSLYLDASAAETGPELFLRNLSGIDDEVIELVRELLAQQPELLPDLHRACWLPKEWTGCRPALEPGRKLVDRFEIIDFLGAGGAGEVYRAFDHRQLNFVALKTLHRELAGNPSALRMLRNELNTARSVTDPNVCRLHDVHWSSDFESPPFFTMDLLDGVTLSQYISGNGRFDSAAAMPIVRQMIAGLAAIHARNIVHGDFKSGNVMLAEDGTRAIVMDFGLAREIVPGVSLDMTLAGACFAGTPAFMAPEQLRGGKATFASDIYSLGVALFQMVTGRLPFDGDNPLEVVTRRLSEDAPSPRRFAPKLKRSWEYTIRCCLAADPNVRPASVLAVGKVLESTPPMLWGRRRFLIGASAAAVSLAGTVAWALSSTGHPVTVELFDIENPTEDRTLDYIAGGMTRELLRRFASIRSAWIIPAHRTFSRQSPSDRSELALSGTLTPNGVNEFKLLIRLNESRTGKSVWSEVFDRSRFAGLLPMQDEVSKQSARQLQRRISASRSAAFATWADWLPGFGNPGTAPTWSTVAFDLYMRGNSLLQESTPESAHAAVGFLEQAIAEDAHFALALAALSEAHQMLLDFGHDKNSSSSAAARDYALKAVREDPSLAEAHAAMGAIDQMDWDWLGAESEYGRAMQLKPRFPKAIRWRAGLVLQFERFDEAIAGFEEAYRLDPYDRSAVSGHGLTLIHAGRLREAVTFLEREIGDREMAMARINLLIALGLLAKRSQGSESTEFFRRAFDQAETLAAIERHAPSGLSERSDAAHAWLYSLCHQPELAAPYLERLERDVEAGQTSPSFLAPTYVAQARYDMALSALERAVFMRDRSVMNMRANILYLELRGMPRFEALLRTAHLR
jgi:serine/threonine-protein kinase